MIEIEQISGDIAEKTCNEIMIKLPEYFEMPEANEYYAKTIKENINLIAKINDQYVGLISLEFPYHNNANIFWMAILPEYQNQGVGTKLIVSACELAKEKQAKTITLETVSPKDNNMNYLKTYSFYLKNGFVPLFDLKPQNCGWTAVYMLKNISLDEI